MSNRLNLRPSFFTYFQYCWGSLSLHLCWKSQKKKKWGDLSFSHIYRTTQNWNPLTVPPLGLLSVRVIWFHSCWPGWRLKWTIIEEQFHGVRLRPVSEQKKKKKEKLRLTSTTATSTFTFGGKPSSGWKHLAMATSRWMVARRSLLWMTDRRAAENKTQKKNNMHGCARTQSLRFSWNQILKYSLCWHFSAIAILCIQYIHCLSILFITSDRLKRLKLQQHW